MGTTWRTKSDLVFAIDHTKKQASLMILHGALIREQGLTFGIIVVKAHVTQNSFEASRFITTVGAATFPGVPIVLMSQDQRGVPTFYGPRDIVNFLAGVPVEAIPWRRYTIS